MRRFGKGDELLLLFLLFVLLGAFLLRTGGEKGDVYAEITLEGKVYKSVKLTGHRGRERLEIETDLGKNAVVLEDETIRVETADCPDKICVKTGSLSKPGETAACLPHKLLIEVIEKQN